MRTSFKGTGDIARSLMVSLMLLFLIACTATTPVASAPTATGLPESAPVLPTRTAAMEPTAAQARLPTAPPTEPSTDTPQPTILTLWHAFEKGSPDESALQTAVTEVARVKSNVTISITRVSSDQIFSRFAREAAAGRGPDLFLASDDELGMLVRRNLLQPVDSWVKDTQSSISQIAIKGQTLNGKQWGIPVAFKVTALYYNSAHLAEPPKTTSDLIKTIKTGSRIGINPNCFHNFGWYAAFGGGIFDDKFNTAIDKLEGTAAAFAYLKVLKETTGAANFFDDGNKADAAFETAKIDLIINGSWALHDYRKALGASLKVGLIPSGPVGAASPMVGVDAFYINANTSNAAEAAWLALALTSKENQKRFADTVGWVPVRVDVQSADAAVQSFASQAALGTNRPQVPELNGYWSSFCGTYDEVLKNGANPTTAVEKAYKTMKMINGK